MKYVLLILAVLYMLGCAHRPAAPTGLHIVEPVEQVEVFDPCDPDRGEQQDVVIQSKGKAFNSAQTGCI